MLISLKNKCCDLVAYYFVPITSKKDAKDVCSKVLFHTWRTTTSTTGSMVTNEGACCKWTYRHVVKDINAWISNYHCRILVATELFLSGIQCNMKSFFASDMNQPFKSIHLHIACRCGKQFSVSIAPIGCKKLTLATPNSELLFGYVCKVVCNSLHLW